MAKMISRNDVIETCKNGIDWIKDIIINAFYESIYHEKERVYNDTIEIGIKNTFSALYDANVNDEEILRIVCKYWEISKQEAANLLINEKKQAVIRNLRQYMKLQGYEMCEINDFFQEHQVINKIRRNKELWKLKDNPARLFKIIQNYE